MPELPEVETIRQQLRENLLPFKIEKETRSDVFLSILKKEEFSLIGKKIVEFERHGKMLVMRLDKGWVLSHFGMSGSWRFSDRPLTDVKHVHFQYEGRVGKKKMFLSYVDPRRFGNMYIVNLKSKQEHIKKMGVDVSSPDFSISVLKEKIKKYPNKILKPFLLEQNHFAGIGNYMASEICARAGILPQREVSTLSQHEIKKIIKANHSVLTDAIKNNGTTFSGGYSDANGDKGEGVKNLVVFYQKICGLCKKENVIKINLASRGTYYCPSCQK